MSEISKRFRERNCLEISLTFFLMLIIRSTFEIDLFFRSIFDIAFTFSSSFSTLETDDVFRLKIFFFWSAELIVSKLVSILTLASLDDDVSKFLSLSTYVEYEFFLRQISRWSQWSDQKVKKSLIIFSINSCFFIQDLFKINLWFFNLMIKKNVKLFRWSFTVKIKYMTWMITTFVFSSYFRMSLIFINSWNDIFNLSQTFRANSLSMKAYFELSVFNKAVVLNSSLFSKVQRISNARSLNKSFDKDDADTKRILSLFFAFMKKNSNFSNRIISQFLSTLLT